MSVKMPMGCSTSVSSDSPAEMLYPLFLKHPDPSSNELDLMLTDNDRVLSESE